MYPGRPMPPRRPMPPWHIPPHNQGQYVHPKSNILSTFQTSDGKLDVEKITTTAQQVMKIYNQVSPMFSKFIKK
ncbi:YppG family protein [Alteribacillus sp. JSM 102045]|uniref:YppG family protein n=1 Tax=Alteribacillus sp. JSM 102045 TaxID=1562101 RepID=UPI0035C1B966